MSEQIQQADRIQQLEDQLKAIAMAQSECVLANMGTAEQAYVALHTRLADILGNEPGALSRVALGERFEPGMSHKGVAQYRFAKIQGRSDVREQALAQMWERQNQDDDTSKPLLATLLSQDSHDSIWAMKMKSPYTQPAATAAATVIQWLGTPVGFAKLTDALAVAGYEIVDKG